MNMACLIHGEKDLRIENFPIQKPTEGEITIKTGFMGICGSDLHYYHEGGIGTAIRVQEPIVPGHEFSGTVAALGQGVSSFSTGDRVAINPSKPCGQCTYCKEGLKHHCSSMKFMGSAMFFPHTHGGCQEYVNVLPEQCYKIEEHVSLQEAACCEPLSVGLHACNRAGSLVGKTVMVMGCGPIGALAIAAIKYSGASYVIATDLEDYSLEIAKKMGADKVINIKKNLIDINEYQKEKGQIDIVFECSGSLKAIDMAINCLKPLGKLVQVGTGGEMPIALSKMVGKEIDWVGTFRFDKEFKLSVELLNNKKINVKPVLTGTYSLENALDAFESATDRTRHSKVQITLDKTAN